MIKWCGPQGTPVIALLIKMKDHNEKKFALSLPPNRTYKYKKKKNVNLILEWGEKEKYRKAKDILK